MVHKLTLEVPEEVYQPLAQAALQTGASPEALAVEWLAAVSRQAAHDPVEQFIGTIHGQVPDWADQHDKHLGQALKDQLSGDNAAGG